MTFHAQSKPEEFEVQFLESLRARYEDEGFTFTTHPNRIQLPEFLGSYIPDALAQKPGHNVAIEVKQAHRPARERALQEIRRLFEGHPDWQFRVIFMRGDPSQSMRIPHSDPSAIEKRMREVRELILRGERRPAFVMAWSLLEATVRTLSGELESRPRTPGTVVQTLAMNGYIDPEMESSIRALIQLRDQIVHGDLEAEPQIADIELVLSAIESALSASSPNHRPKH